MKTENREQNEDGKVGGEQKEDGPPIGNRMKRKNRKQKEDGAPISNGEQNEEEK